MKNLLCLFGFHRFAVIMSKTNSGFEIEASRSKPVPKGCILVTPFKGNEEFRLKVCTRAGCCKTIDEIGPAREKYMAWRQQEFPKLGKVLPFPVRRAG